MQASLAAFESVYRRELPFVWAAARRLGVHPAVLDDAVQDVFLTAYRRWGDLHHDVSPRAWLYGVTRRVAFRYRRSHARTVRRKHAVAQGGEARPIVPHRERDEAHDVDAVLAVLEPARREVFVMSELLDMSGPEIAAQLEIPLNTVYSRLRLARRELEPRLRRGVGAWAGSVRKRDRPPPEQTQRTWAVLATRLGPLSGAAGATGATGTLGTIGAWVGGRAVAVALVVGVWTVAAVAAPQRERERDRDERVVETVADGEPERAHERGGTSSRAPSAAPPGSVTQVASVPAAALPPGPDDPPPRASAPSSGRSPASPPKLGPAEAPTPAPTEPGLEDEVAVLDRASAALRDGDAAQALQRLAEHERRFSTGRLVDVRKATRVRALCRLGRDAQARAEATVLRREHPQSAVAQRTPLGCEEE
jgi:RNA polymerase sigma factor (sigma-70 family)